MDLRRSPSRRVVVTGLGALSAAGLTKEALWESLLAGRSGIGPITRFDASDMASRIAGEVKGFDPVRAIDPAMKPRRMSRQTQLGVAAAIQAIDDARLDSGSMQQQRVAVIAGSSTSSAEVIAQSALRVALEGPGSALHSTVESAGPQSLPTAISQLLDSKRVFARALSSACAAGLDAIGEAFHMLRHGQADLIVCGGADALISRMPMAEFSIVGLSSTRNHEPERASRPFDRERDSGVLAEGAALVVLETLENARSRRARCYLELLGYHSRMDQRGFTSSSGLAETMEQAILEAGIPAGQVDFISAWGPGHPVLDQSETKAIKRVFGPRAYDIGVSSIKGVIGNPGAAAGPLQVVATAFSYQHGLLPPTANYEQRDIFCDLDYLQGKPRRARLRYTLLNSHGIGGGNSTLAVAGPPN